MRRAKDILPILLFTVFTISVKAEGSPEDVMVPDGAKLLQFEAGVGNQHGWYEALSSTNRFSVEFPALYQEWHTTLTEQDAPTFSLGTTTKDGTKYLISEFPAPEKGEFQNTEKAIKAFFKGKRRRYTRNIFYKGAKGKEVKVNTKLSSTTYRFLFTEKYTYQLSVEYLRENRSKSAQDARVFFASLKLF